jgi:hypothetical protein
MLWRSSGNRSVGLPNPQVGSTSAVAGLTVARSRPLVPPRETLRP